MEDRLAGWVGSRSSGTAGVSGRSFGGAADQALEVAEHLAVEVVDAVEDGVDEAASASAALRAQRGGRRDAEGADLPGGVGDEDGRVLADGARGARRRRSRGSAR